MATKKTRGRKTNKFKADESLSAAPLTKEEEEFIAEHHELITTKRICKELGRNVEDLALPIIEEYVNKLIQKKKKDKSKIKVDKDETSNKINGIPITDIFNEDEPDIGNIDPINPDSIEQLLEKNKIFNTTQFVSKEKILLYFIDKSEAFSKKEFTRLVMTFSDLADQYKEELNASDFQSCLQLCSTQILLDRQDLFEHLGHPNFSAKTRSELLKNITKLREELSISRQERLKKDPTKTLNIAELSEKFSKDKFKKILQSEDNKDADELLSFSDRINKEYITSENKQPSMEDNAMFLGISSSDINKLKPNAFNKEIEDAINNLSRIEDIILKNLYLDKDIFFKKIEDKFPNIHKLFKDRFTNSIK